MITAYALDHNKFPILVSILRDAVRFGRKDGVRIEIGETLFLSDALNEVRAIKDGEADIVEKANELTNGICSSKLVDSKLLVDASQLCRLERSLQSEKLWRLRKC